jgi:D-aminopeptidase
LRKLNLDAAVTASFKKGAAMLQAGSRNLITDVDGLLVGQVHDERLRSGVTVILPREPARAAVDIRGGGPGEREAASLDLQGVVGAIHALVLSGGSAFGLDAATGAQSFLRERGVGFPVGPVRVPIVPQAILFDLLNGGDKDWPRRPPYQDMAYEACERAGQDFALGSAGAGYGATTVNLKGGVGSASAVTGDGVTIGALAAVNAVGSVTIGDGPHFWAAPWELGGEFGGRGWPQPMPPEALEPRLKGGAEAGANTTLGVVAVDAALSRADLKRLAIMAQAGMARAIYPVHTPLDGDIVFALSLGDRRLADPVADLARLGAHAANVLARAVARGVYEASGWDGAPSYREMFLRLSLPITAISNS